ncbi:hypothetical protein [Sphingobacterium suaedae]|uniref:DUF5056 domain-containing protein n=1 Tax=Sphingobacterium suaedae TaxID=1686402 RepID=A0ABW5KEJ8_9SPHI
MAEKPTDDDLFFRMMARGKLTITNDRFEKDLRNKIEHENWKRKQFAKSRVMSILFFVLGISLGYWKFDFLMESIQHTFPISLSHTAFLFQLFFVVFILFQINSILKLIVKH